MTLREMERDSIRHFVAQAASEGYLGSIVLDYGCGKQPYREIVEASLPLGGQYQAFDQVRFPANVSDKNVGEGDPLVMSGWGSILCTQVLQYIPRPGKLVLQFKEALRPGGYLVMTYPTNWPEVESADLWRFTKAGMEFMLAESGFTIVMHERRARFDIDSASEWFYTGYGVVARA